MVDSCNISQFVCSVTLLPRWWGRDDGLQVIRMLAGRNSLHRRRSSGHRALHPQNTLVRKKCVLRCLLLINLVPWSRNLWPPTNVTDRPGCTLSSARCGWRETSHTGRSVLSGWSRLSQWPRVGKRLGIAWTRAPSWGKPLHWGFEALGCSPWDSAWTGCHVSSNSHVQKCAQIRTSYYITRDVRRQQGHTRKSTCSECLAFQPAWLVSVLPAVNYICDPGCSVLQRACWLVTRGPVRVDAAPLDLSFSTSCACQDSRNDRSYKVCNLPCSYPTPNIWFETLYRKDDDRAQEVRQD